MTRAMSGLTSIERIGGDLPAGPDTATVLIVDDDPRNLLAIESVFENANFNLQKAQTGAEALLALMEGDFAAIVLDVQMPELNGIELARMIKQRRKTQHIPIIFLTAHFREDEHAILGYDVGAVDYLTKPVNPMVLRSKVSVFVELFTKTRALAAMHRAAQEAEDALREANSQLAARNESLEREAEERELRIRAELARAEAEEASAEKDRFIAMLSHELRTPLTPVLAEVQLAKTNPEYDPASFREMLDVIERNILLETKLIDDLLDLNRLAFGKLKLDRRPVEVAAAAEDAIGFCRSEANAKSITIDVNVTRGLKVEADPARLQQIIWNLVRNAIRYSPEHRHVVVTGECSGPGEVIVTVADRGCGISSERLPRIFTAFERAANPEIQGAPGLGLGLAICKALVELHGGTITAQSDGEGRGATFQLRLPLVFDQPRPAHTPEATRPYTGDGRKVLLVEDHADTLKSMTRLLARRGLQVTACSNVTDALRAVATGSFNLVISDLGLADANGFELIRRARANGFSRGAIAVSGFSMESDIAAAREAGFDIHLSKPIEIAKLDHAIASLLGGTT
jgi:signal transduction histidine kinase